MQQGDKFLIKYPVTDELFWGFRNTFKQENPFHTDDEISRSKGYKAKIMPGNLLNGLISNFVGEHLPFKNSLFHALSIKFLYPVYLYDHLEFSAEVVNYSEAVDVYEIKGFFQNQDNKKVAKFTIEIGKIKG